MHERTKTYFYDQPMDYKEALFISDYIFNRYALNSSVLCINENIDRYIIVINSVLDNRQFDIVQSIIEGYLLHANKENYIINLLNK
jgi:hypothetical protein